MHQKQLKTPIEELILASHNKGKLAELDKMLTPYGVAVTSSAALDLIEPEETETTFHGNAKIKALSAMEATGKPSLADDSGLSCYALNGAPGVYSARWAGPDRDFDLAMARIAEEIKKFEDHRAAFVSVLAFAVPGKDVQFFEGRCEGTIVYPPKGSNGFGYDPIFIPEGSVRTFGQMTPDQKEKYSHRAIALKKFIETVF